MVDIVGVLAGALGLSTPQPSGRRVTNGSYKAYQFHVATPTREMKHGASSVNIRRSRRLQTIKRPLVDGGPVRDWGADHSVFTAEIIFIGPNYVTEFESFKAILNQGTPGILVLPTEPKAVIAVFQDMDENVAVEDGESKRVRVTWIEHIENAQQISSTVTTTLTVDQTADKVFSDLDTSKSFLQDNPLINGIKAFESGLSQIRSVTNAVLALDQGVRNKIKQLAANIDGTISLVETAVNEITSIFGTDKKIIRGPRPTVATTSLGYDPETGQVIASSNEPDTVTAPASPLAQPATPSTVSIPTGDLSTPGGVQLFAGKVVAQMKSDRDTLVGLTSGRTDDLIQSLTASINSFQDFVNAVAPNNQREFVVPLDMSLAEVLFFNGISIEELNSVHQQNRHILDAFVVTKGTTVLL